MSSEGASEINIENERLVGLIMEGDHKAVELLFAKYMPQLRRAAAWMLPNSCDSEDAVQDGLLLAYRKLNQYQGRAKFSTWLNAIVINSARIKARKQRTRPTTSLDQDASSRDGLRIGQLLVDQRPNPEETFIAGERSRILARTMKNLSKNSRIVIDLMDIEGLRGREAAQRLGISLSALKTRHHRARRAIVRQIQALPNTDTID